MHLWETGDLRATRRERGVLYHEFLRVPSMSAGLYELAAGAPDPQSPHTEDELYVVLAGRASFTTRGQTRPVGPGSVIYVERDVEHRFVDVEEELSVVVVFSPAEHSAPATDADVQGDQLF